MSDWRDDYRELEKVMPGITVRIVALAATVGHNNGLSLKASANLEHGIVRVVLDALRSDPIGALVFVPPDDAIGDIVRAIRIAAKARNWHSLKFISVGRNVFARMVEQMSERGGMPKPAVTVYRVLGYEVRCDPDALPGSIRTIFDDARWQYYCRKCGTCREGALAAPAGIGGYAWACPECGSHDIGSVEI